MKIKLLVVFVGLYFCGLAMAETATLHYESEPGDYIGQGETRTYTEQDGIFRIFRTFGNGVEVNFQNGEWWYLNFEAPFANELDAGYYPNAQRWPFQDEDKPGLDFSGDGRGCNTLTGEFTVNEAVFDWFGVPRKFSATLEQHCEGADPALYGSIDYDFGGMGPVSLTVGNILVVNQNLILELLPNGSVVHKIPILESDGDPSDAEDARDIVVSDRGHIHVFNGTFNPVLSSLDPQTGNWSHVSYPDWNIESNLSYGGIAVNKDYVYVTDQFTLSGIVRFNTRSYEGRRYSEGLNYIDLTVGFDGRLYALRNDEVTVDVYDPVTMLLEKTVTLDSQVRAIAVNVIGKIFASSWDGYIYRFDAAGGYQTSINAGAGSLQDIDLAPTGQIVAGTSWETKVVITDQVLSSVDLLELPAPAAGDVFVGFVVEPTVILRDGFEAMCAWFPNPGDLGCNDWTPGEPNPYPPGWTPADPPPPGWESCNPECFIGKAEFDSIPEAGMTMDFGEAGVSYASPERYVEVTNPGGSYLIQTCRIEGDYADDFTMEGCDEAVAIGLLPSTSVMLELTCVPSSVGGRTASLVISHNDADESPATFPLSCSGVDSSECAWFPDPDDPGCNAWLPGEPNPYPPDWTPEDPPPEGWEYCNPVCTIGEA